MGTNASKKSVVAVAAATTLLVSSCGYGGGNDGGEGTTTLNLLVPSYSDNTQSLWEDVIEGFESENEGISVNLEMQSWENIESVLNTKIQGGEAPDIFNGGPFSEYAADEMLRPASDITSSEVLEDFQESFAENEMLDGTQYGLPLLASSRALFYNQELMDEAGVTEVPTTWDELHAAAQQISDETSAAGYGMPLGSEEAQGEALIWFAGAGGGFGDETAIEIDTPENIEAAEFMKKMIDDGVTQSDPGATQRTPMLNSFIQGNIGFVYGLPQTVSQIEDQNPDLDYGIDEVATKDGSSSTLGVADRLISFENEDTDAETVQAFMDYFFSPDVYVEWVQSEGFLPTTVSGAEALESDETLSPFLNLLPDAQFYPTTNPSWNATDGAFKALMGQLDSDMSAEEVLEQISQRVDSSGE